MLTINGTLEGELKLCIPNLEVKEQLYNYLLNNYRENELNINDYHRGQLHRRMAYRSQWRDYFEYIADCLHLYASQRGKIKGESFVHGFTLALPP